MKNKLINLGIVFALILTLVTPLLAAADKTTTLTIHKLKYDTDLSTDKKIKNDGTEKTYDSTILPYNATDYGAIGFTLYRLDSAKTIAKLKEENGNSQSVADKVAADIEGNTTAGLITKVEVAEVKREEGTEPLSMTVKTTTTDGEYFLLVETTSPATVVAKAQPMLLQFPMRSTDGKSYLDTVHLYPKNKVDETSREIEFTKNVLKVDGDNASEVPFEGADFEVYKGKPGAGEKLMKDGNPVKLTSDAQGKFKLTGLTVGNYYLVEIGNDKVDSLNPEDTKSKSKNFIASIDAKNDANNKYAFRMDEDGHIYKITGWNGDTAQTNKGTEYKAEDQKLPTIKNSIKPSTSKKLVTDAKSIGYSDVLEYEIKVNMPAGFGTKGVEEKIVINDKITEGVIIDTDSFKLTDGNGKQITKEYNVEKVADNEVNITLNKTILSQSETPSYKPITIKYSVKLSKDFKIDKDVEIKNTIVPKYTIGENVFDEPENPVKPENPDEPTPDKTKEVTVKTYTKNLRKLDSGLFETGAVKNPLAGAKFILGRKIGTKVEYRKEDAANKYAWTETKTEAQLVASGTDGTFKFEGLASKTADGTVITYFAEEVEAPENYKLPVNEKDRKHEFNFLGDNTTLEITNNKSVDAPMTGYEKSVITVGVMLLIAIISGVVLLLNNKKKNQIA